jgi:hypothetical protein
MDMVEQTLAGIAWLNQRMGIWSFVLPVVFAATVLALLLKNYKNPSRKNSGLLLSAYAVIYIFSGATIFIGKDFMGTTAALSGAIGLWLVAAFLILDVIFSWTEIRIPQQSHLKILSWSLIFAGIFFYPVLEILLGFTYPGMVFFGAECPTTISLIGVFIGSIPKVNKPLFVIISLNAIFTGGFFAVNGATFDYLYVLAGILGVSMLVVHFRDIFTGHSKATGYA